MDLEKFFDRVNHDILMSRLARQVKDKRILLLIRRYLQAGLMEGGVVSQRVEGTPQGGPLSPLLSNVLLDELDRELERRGHRFVRYADDCNIYVRSKRAGERVLASVEAFLWRQLRLKVNRDKSAVDRLIQQALHQVLQPIFEPTFSEGSFGFRPGRNAHQALRRARQYVAQGKRWVVDMDLEKFFDRVNHDLLMGKLAARIGDARVLTLIRRYLEAGMMADGLVQPRREGTPQGGPLSPLLSNILLTELDRELERRGHAFCRYADDCNIYVGSERAGVGLLQSLNPVLRGWAAYFQLAETRRVLEERDGWLRHQLRSVLWRQGKRRYRRARMLMQRGLTRERAWRSACNQRGPWWNAGASHMHAAFPKSWFDTQGLVSLLGTVQRLQRAS